MNPLALAGLFGGGAQALSGLFGLGHKSKGSNPAYAANKELNQIPGQIKPYYDPYINAGKESLGTLQNQYGQLSNDPGKRFAELGAGYKESPGYQATLREALAGANNAAAMGGGGGLGTPGHQQYAAQAAGDVANQDYEQYLNHIMDLYGKGLGGEQNLETQGYGASTGYGDVLGQIGGQKANYAAAGQDWKNQRNQQNWSNLFGGLGQAGSSYALSPLLDQYMNQYMKGGH